MKTNTETMIDGKLYFALVGYPKFGFRYDEAEKKYSIANMETKTATPAFADEIINSEVPLESWTANYVVVRIGGYYYLADNNGNCFHQNKKPFVICRNVFVFDINSKRVIAEDMEKKVIDENIKKIIVEEYSGIKYAFGCEKNAKYLITISGTLLRGDEDVLLSIKDFTSINEGFIHVEDAQHYEGFVLISNDFSILKIYYEEQSKLQRLLSIGNGVYVGDRIYGNNEIYSCYSIDFDEISYGFWYCKKYGKFTVVKHSITNTTYVYFPNGEIKKYMSNIEIMSAENGFYYRYGDTIFKFDFEGNQIAEEKLSLRDTWFFDILEKLTTK